MDAESFPVREPVFVNPESLGVETAVLKRRLVVLAVADVLMWVVAAWFFLLTDVVWVIPAGSALLTVGTVYDDVQELRARASVTRG